jgi:hypothetical protein
MLISLLSHSWSIHKVITEFGVSEYTVRKWRPLQKTCAIFPELVRTEVWPLSDGVKQSPNVMRMMNTPPVLWQEGHCICETAIWRNHTLCNLQELYVAFCEKHNCFNWIFQISELHPKLCRSKRAPYSMCLWFIRTFYLWCKEHTLHLISV